MSRDQHTFLLELAFSHLPVAVQEECQSGCICAAGDGFAQYSKWKEVGPARLSSGH